MKAARNRHNFKVAAAILMACRGVALSLLLAALLGAAPLRVAAEQDDGMPKVFRAGFLQRIFITTDYRDAKAVLEVHSREISRDLGLDITSSVVMFSDMASMVDAIRKGKLEMATIPSLDYLRIRKTVPLIPSFVGANNEGQGIHYVVITRKDSGIRSFSDLKGKSVLLPPVSSYEPSHLWLEVLLMKTVKEKRDTFFRQVMESPKISQAIMGVFFRKADAAIVTRAGLDISRQLNPQLETELIVLAESPSLNDMVVCMLPNTSEKFRNNLSRSMLRLNETKSGRQLYTIFQSGGMTLFKPAYLEGLENLIHEHDRLKAKTVLRK